MCGICGITDFRSELLSDALLHGMAATIAHRGPDDRGVYTQGAVGLAQTRLSIRDLSAAGHQPMFSPDGACALVYNGELYNDPELREVLMAKGHTFTGHSDTETLLAAYLEWGTAAFEKLEGMFALALWDGRTRTLHLARDRFGIKPMYYHLRDGDVVFGSEVKTLLASGRVARALDWEAFNEFLVYGTALGEHSLFDGVRKLLPGHRMEISPGGVRMEAYATIYDSPPCSDSLETAVGRVRELLDQAVRSHLISDVPVGVFLSGGIDSSALTALAARHYAGRIKTYSVGFDFDKGVNELAKAKRVAEHFGTEHHELHIQGGNMPDVIERLVRSHDEPFGDAANVPLYLLCEQLQGSVKVVLQGDGGDEIFAGYRRYNILSQEKMWRTLARAGLPLMTAMPRGERYHRLHRFLLALRQDNPALRMALLLTEEAYDNPPSRVLSDAAQAQVRPYDPYARYRHFQERFQELDPVQRMLYTDCSVILPDIFLEKVDKATMAHSIEVRVPMLDTPMARYVMGLPSSYKVRKGQKKWLLREALRGVVPDDILDAPKTGFGVPHAHWLRTSLASYLKAVLLDDSTQQSGLFDRHRLESCIEEHISGRRNNGFLLYKLLNFALWRKFYLAGGAPQ
jgi:asparagine synthase (glutamine-hydrolysing)